MTSNARNRPGRRGNDPRGANSHQQRQSTSASAASRDGSSNTYQSRRGGKAGSNLSRSSDNIQNGPTTTPTTPAPSDDHVPIAGFNADVVEAMLKQGYEAKAPLHKLDNKPQATNPQSPWGVKCEYSPAHQTISINSVEAGAMASGKDFWLDLRRQVFALQQTGGISQGG
ncbi:hypothetical protein AYL99_02928 [Fonsecaea erecta]|uniref:Uncharacterized protein n=1 Tax=Fonsecaea erecta TaxID=1367422 RepID=A0A178ZW66_9EURO|nr:hypothetical protein AYL99_02928 [Fonsecaea erecta]OAP63701.1 hypothetical protein AYL99_02928 [Fonsecaea erecta]